MDYFYLYNCQDMDNYPNSSSNGRLSRKRTYWSLIIGLCTLLLTTPSAAQQLKPGFDPKEYLEVLGIDFLHADTPWVNYQVPAPANARLIYRSAESGLHNRWDLWLRDNQTAVISIRGTVGRKESWLENFYAGMIPATGVLRLNDSTLFRYRLAREERASVHAGWTLALASMAPDIVAHIRDLYSKGVREFLISGHSQGGAISFLLRSYLEYFDEPGFPKDIVFKTYCSAAPKPGNLYYAYDYDFITRNGWGLRVVNTQDWVPETPFSVQTTADFNMPNPFMNVKGALRKQNYLARIVLGTMYNQLDRSTKRASRRMQKTLGKRLAGQVKKAMPGYELPAFVKSHNYMPAGTPVILHPDTAYSSRYVYDGKNIFIHHMYAPYRDLVNSNYP
jgi:hypothetical protein